MTKHDPVGKANAITDLLSTGAFTVEHIARMLKMHPTTVRRTMLNLHSNRKVFIADWQIRGTATIAMYRAGDDEDVPAPEGRNPRAAKCAEMRRPTKCVAFRNEFETLFFGSAGQVKGAMQ